MKFSFIDPKTKKALVLPIPPERMSALIGTKVLSFEPTVLGDIEYPRGRSPVQFTLEGLLPGEFSGLEGLASDWTPEDVVNQWKVWADAKGASGKEIRFIVTETDWNLPVFLRNIEAEYAGGYGNMTYTMELTEWRPFTVKEVKPKTSGKKTSRPTPTKPKTHLVKKGDSLSKIAQKLGGSAKKWTELWAINKGNIKSKNPDKILPGEKLTIPTGWLK